MLLAGLGMVKTMSFVAWAPFTLATPPAVQPCAHPVPQLAYAEFAPFRSHVDVLLSRNTRGSCGEDASGLNLVSL